MRSLTPVVVLTGLVVAGCSTGEPAASAPGATSAPAVAAPSRSAAPACAPARTPRFAWPQQVPQDLPQPAGAVFQTTQTAKGVTVVRFTTSGSLRDGVLFVVHDLQKAGFTLGRGDSEPSEADAPFGKGDAQGIIKMQSVGQCSTNWLLAVARRQVNGGSPVLPTPRATGTPLPFG